VLADHPKVQHYVPQLLLRGFVRTKKKLLYVYDKQTDKVFRTTPRNVAAESGFYDIPVPEGVVTIEPGLCALEDKAGAIITEIRRTGTIKNMTEEQQALLSAFVAVQHLRTPQYRANLLHMDQQIRARLEAAGHDPDKIENYRSFQNDEEVKAFSLSFIESAVRDLSPFVFDKDWILVRTATARPYMIGDNPVSMYNQIDSRLRGNIGFAVRGIQISLPIAEDLLLLMACRTIGDDVRRTKGEIERLKTLAPFRDQAIQHEKRFKRLIDAFTYGIPDFAQAENVMHFNAQQIRLAERWVFSPDGNFDLVRQMIANNPNVRTGPRGTVS
jgi:hypothetical protein